MERGECKVVGACNNKLREMVESGDENDKLRTVECLRGRLLAEREASKAAKEESELMIKRLMQLERLLAEEMKYRDKAEKRLRYALKKLKSLKLINGSGTSASSEEFMNSNLRSSSSSHDSAESIRHCDEEKGELGGGVSGMNSIDSSSDQLYVADSKEGSWSSDGSVQSVNMVNQDFSEKCNESKCDSNGELSIENRSEASNNVKDGNENRCPMEFETKTDLENNTPEASMQI